MLDEKQREKIVLAVSPFLAAGAMPLGVKTGIGEYMVGVAGHYFFVDNDGEVQVEVTAAVKDEAEARTRAERSRRISVVDQVLGLSSGSGYRWFLGHAPADLEDRVRMLGLPALQYAMHYEQVTAESKRLLEQERLLDLAWFQVPGLEYTPMLLQEIGRQVKGVTTDSGMKGAFSAAIKAVESQAWLGRSTSQPFMVLPYKRFPEEVWRLLQIRHRVSQPLPEGKKTRRIEIPELEGKLA